MKKIYLITHNSNKIKEFKNLLEPDIEVIPIDFNYMEPKADTCEEVVKLCLNQAHETAKQVLKKTPDFPICIEDSGLFIEKLKGFPGINTAFCKNRIGNSGLLKLMEDYPNDYDRRIFYQSTIGFFDGKIKRIFSGQEEGVLSKEVRGNFGWDEDKVFIPIQSNPKKLTYGELKTENTICIFRTRALEKLKNFLEEEYF